MGNNNLIYTPKYKIPIGEPIKNQDGTYAIIVKKANASQYDVISLEKFYNEVVSKATLK